MKMKTKNSITIVTLGLIALGLSATVNAAGGNIDAERETADYEKAYVEFYNNRSHDHAVPVTVASPYIDSETFENIKLPLVVNVEFIVNEKGRPTHVTVKPDTDYTIANPVIGAIYDWHFAPAMRDGKAVPEHVGLAIRFVDAKTFDTETKHGKSVTTTMSFLPVAGAKSATVAAKD